MSCGDDLAQEGLRAVLLWRGEDLGGRALFDDAALVEEQHAVGEIMSKAHLMRDQQHGHIGLVGQALHDFQHFLDVERSEIARFNPGFAGVTESASRFAYLVVHDHETVGVVVIRDAADGVGQVELDYVTARYRDFTPGEFVWRHSGLFTGRGWRTIRTPEAMVGAYYERLGFRRDGDAWALDTAGVPRS